MSSEELTKQLGDQMIRFDRKTWAKCYFEKLDADYLGSFSQPVFESRLKANNYQIHPRQLSATSKEAWEKWAADAVPKAQAADNVMALCSIFDGADEISFRMLNAMVQCSDQKD